MINLLAQSQQNSAGDINEAVVAFASALFGALAGFGFSYYLDFLKHKKQSREIYSVFIGQILANLEIISGNLSLLEQEQEFLKNKSVSTAQLVKLQFSTWDLFRTYLPAQLVNKEVLLQIELTVALTHSLG